MAVYRIDGYLISNVRRNSKFIFGDFFVRADVDKINRIYNIRIRKTLRVKCEKSKEHPNGYRIEKIEDYVDLEHFKKFWGGCWRLIEHKEEEI